MLIEAKPIGQRLDNTKTALQRARKRLAQTQEGLSLAQQTVETAQMEETKPAAGLAELEATVAASPQAPSAHSLSALEDHLMAAVEQLRQLDALKPVIADEARDHCTA